MPAIPYLSGGEDLTAARMNLIFEELDRKLSLITDGKSIMLLRDMTNGTRFLPVRLFGKLFCFLDEDVIPDPSELVAGQYPNNWLPGIGGRGFSSVLNGFSDRYRPYDHSVFTDAVTNTTVWRTRLYPDTPKHHFADVERGFVRLNKPDNSYYTAAGVATTEDLFDYSLECHTKTVTPNGRDAAATATLTDGVVTGLTLTAGGLDYLTPPLITFRDAITNDLLPDVTAHCYIDPPTGEVVLLVLDSGGSGLTDPPLVQFAQREAATPVACNLITSAVDNGAEAFTPRVPLLYEQAEIVIDQDLALNEFNFPHTYNRYNCFRFHNMRPVQITVRFRDADNSELFHVDIPALSSKCVRRVPGGGNNYTAGYTHFQKFLPGDPRFYSKEMPDGMNNVVNPSIVFAWVQMLVDYKFAELDPGQFWNAASVYCNANYAATGDPAYARWVHSRAGTGKGWFEPVADGTLAGDLIHHKGEIVVADTDATSDWTYALTMQEFSHFYMVRIQTNHAFVSCSATLNGVELVDGVDYTATLFNASGLPPGSIPGQAEYIGAIGDPNGDRVLGFQFYSGLTVQIGDTIDLLVTYRPPLAKDSLTFNGYGSMVADFAAAGVTATVDADGVTLEGADLIGKSTNLIHNGTGAHIVKSGGVIENKTPDAIATAAEAAESDATSHYNLPTPATANTDYVFEVTDAATYYLVEIGPDIEYVGVSNAVDVGVSFATNGYFLSNADAIDTIGANPSVNLGTIGEVVADTNLKHFLVFYIEPSPDPVGYTVTVTVTTRDWNSDWDEFAASCEADKYFYANVKTGFADKRIHAWSNTLSQDAEVVGIVYESLAAAQAANPGITFELLGDLGVPDGDWVVVVAPTTPDYDSVSILVSGAVVATYITASDYVVTALAQNDAKIRLAEDTVADLKGMEPFGLPDSGQAYPLTDYTNDALAMTGFGPVLTARRETLLRCKGSGEPTIYQRSTHGKRVELLETKQYEDASFQIGKLAGWPDYKAGNTEVSVSNLFGDGVSEVVPKHNAGAFLTPRVDMVYGRFIFKNALGPALAYNVNTGLPYENLTTKLTPSAARMFFLGYCTQVEFPGRTYNNPYYPPTTPDFTTTEYAATLADDTVKAAIGAGFVKTGFAFLKPYESITPLTGLSYWVNEVNLTFSTPEYSYQYSFASENTWYESNVDRIVAGTTQPEDGDLGASFSGGDRVVFFERMPIEFDHYNNLASLVNGLSRYRPVDFTMLYGDYSNAFGVFEVDDGSSPTGNTLRPLDCYARLQSTFPATVAAGYWNSSRITVFFLEQIVNEIGAVTKTKADLPDGWSQLSDLSQKAEVLLSLDDLDVLSWHDPLIPASQTYGNAALSSPVRVVDSAYKNWERLTGITGVVNPDDVTFNWIKTSDLKTAVEAWHGGLFKFRHTSVVTPCRIDIPDADLNVIDNELGALEPVYMGTWLSPAPPVPLVVPVVVVERDVRIVPDSTGVWCMNFGLDNICKNAVYPPRVYKPSYIFDFLTWEDSLGDPYDFRMSDSYVMDMTPGSLTNGTTRYLYLSRSGEDSDRRAFEAIGLYKPAIVVRQHQTTGSKYEIRVNRAPVLTKTYPDTQSDTIAKQRADGGTNLVPFTVSAPTPAAGMTELVDNDNAHTVFKQDAQMGGNPFWHRVYLDDMLSF